MRKVREVSPFFWSTFWALTVCDIYFCIWKLPKFIFMRSSFCPFWSAKYLNFGDVSCEIRILSHLIQETYTLRKLKNRVLLFLSSWETNLSDPMVYFCLFKNATLHRVKAKICNFNLNIVRMQFSLVATFFFLILVICFSWNLHLKLSMGF